MPPKGPTLTLETLTTEDGTPVTIGRVESVEIRDEFADAPTSLRATVTALVDHHNGPALRWLFGLPPKKRDARKLKRAKEKARRRRLKHEKDPNSVRPGV